MNEHFASRRGSHWLAAAALDLDMPAESVQVDFSQPIPLFPLPNCVLLPHATVPLHIFEPRYKAMVGEALENAKLIAMATFEGESWQSAYEANPPIREHVCVGRILKNDQLFDGRYNMLLNGVCRARVLRELDPTDSGYRRAMLEPTEELGEMEIDLDDQRSRLETLLHDEHVAKLSAVSSVHKWLSDDLPTPVLSDLVTLTLCRSVEQRYAMLAEPDVNRRAHWLIDFLERTRRTLAQADQLGPAVTEDGYSLN